MADVIRNVVVRVKLEQVKADLQAPDMGPVKREIESTNVSIKQLNQSHQDTSESIQKNNQRNQESFQTFREEAGRLGEGLSKLATAGGLYAVSMDDALPPSVRLFAAIRGGVEQVSGMTAVFSQLGGVLGGPVGVSVALVTTAVTAGAVAWRNYADSAKLAEQESRKLALTRNQRITQTQISDRSRFEDLSSQLIIRDEEELRRESLTQLGRFGLSLNVFRGEANAGRNLEYIGGEALSLAKNIGDIERERLQLTRERMREAENISRLRETELRSQQQLLEAAKGQLSVEREKRQGIEASLGSLSRGEQNRLRQLAGRFGAGEELSRGQLLQLQQLGGGLTAGKVQEEFADRGRGLADEIAAALQVDRNRNFNQAQANFEQQAKALERLADGQGFQAALDNLAQQRDLAIAEGTRTAKAIEDTLRQVQEAVRRIDDEVRQSRDGRL